MTTFLHTADWQIGRRYTSFDPEDGALLAEARFDAVRHIARLAADEQVDAVLVAGDVFDAQTVSDKTIGRLFTALEGFTGPWVMIPGNHDAALAESVWQRAERLGVIPSNVRVVLKPGIIALPEAKLAVLAAPLTQRHTYDDLTAFFDCTETAPGLYRIGLAHGCVQGILADDVDSANPIAADRAAQGRLDYLALGDWHGTRQIDARTWYAGTPEQDRFRNNEPGQVLKVTLADGAEPMVTPHRVGRYRWSQWDETLRVSADAEQLSERLHQLGETDVVSLRLSGQVDLAARAVIDAALIAAAARARVLLADVEALRLQPTDDDVAGLQADGYVAEVLAALRDQQAAPDGEVAGDALNLLAGLLLERRNREGAA